MSDEKNLIITDSGQTLTIQERRGGALVTLLQITAGAITAVQREYIRANIIGRIKQEEADIILKYYYNLDVKK